jgi:hypothetical protein
LVATGKVPAFNRELAIEVPAQIYEWKAAAETRREAQAVQERNRKQFLRAFDSGLAVLGYEHDVAGNGKFMLARWDEQWSYAWQE